MLVRGKHPISGSNYTKFIEQHPELAPKPPGTLAQPPVNPAAPAQEGVKVGDKLDDVKKNIGITMSMGALRPDGTGRIGHLLKNGQRIQSENGRVVKVEPAIGQPPSPSVVKPSVGQDTAFEAAGAASRHAWESDTIKAHQNAIKFHEAAKAAGNDAEYHDDFIQRHAQAIEKIKAGQSGRPAPGGQETTPSVVKPKAETPAKPAIKFGTITDASGKPVRVSKPVQTPAAAVAKVADHIQEVKATEGQRPAKEVKSELVSRLEKAIEDAPNKADASNPEMAAAFEKWKELRQALMQEADSKKLDAIKAEAETLENKWKDKWGTPGVGFWSDYFGDFLERKAFDHGKVTIDIPGDGEFTIPNTKEHLTEVLERAKKLETRTAVPPKTVSRGISKEDREWIAAEKAKQPAEPNLEPPKPGELQSMGGMTYDQRSPQTPTGIKNATVDEERTKRGLPPAMEPARRSFGKVWDEAMAKIDRDPRSQDDLIKELRDQPRAITDTEDAMLLQRQIDLQNQYGNATRELAHAVDDAKEFPNRAAQAEEWKIQVARISDELLDLYNINKRVGTETGRGLNARKMMAYEDYSLASMETRLRAAKDGNL